MIRSILGLDLRMVVEVGLVDAQRDAQLAELDEVLVVDEDARRVVRVDDEDQLGLVGDRVEHALHVVLQVLLAQRDLHRRRRRPGRPATGTSRTSGWSTRNSSPGCRKIRIIASMVSDEPLARAMFSGRQAVELAQLRPQPVAWCRVAVALLGDVGDRLDDLVRRGHRVLVEHHAAVTRAAPTPCRGCRCCTPEPSTPTARPGHEPAWWSLPPFSSSFPERLIRQEAGVAVKQLPSRHLPANSTISYVAFENASAVFTSAGCVLYSSLV